MVGVSSFHHSRVSVGQTRIYAQFASASLTALKDNCLIFKIALFKVFNSLDSVNEEIRRKAVVKFSSRIYTSDEIESPVLLCSNSCSAELS